VPDRLDVDVVVVLLEARGVCLTSERISVNVCNLSLVSIEDLGDLLEGRALGLNVEDSDEDEFEEDPDLRGISMLITRLR
jgi:hypothetical protein